MRNLPQARQRDYREANVMMVSLCRTVSIWTCVALLALLTACGGAERAPAARSKPESALQPAASQNAEKRTTAAAEPVRVSEPAAPGLQLGTLVVVVIDGVRWQEVFRGVDPKYAARLGGGRLDRRKPRDLVPNLYGLMTEGGATLGAPGHGAPFAASGPVFKSLPGYMELLSGRQAWSCRSNRCPPISEPTLADQIATSPSVELGDVLVFSSWPGLARAAAAEPSRIVLSTGRSGGQQLDFLLADSNIRELAEAARVAGPSPGKGDFRADRFTARMALRCLERSRPRFLFVSLGETDVQAHAGSYYRYLDALAFADDFVGRVAELLEGLNAQGWRSTLFVTSDHGRDYNFRDHGAYAPESARSWLIAAGWGIRPGFAAAPRRRRLADLMPTARSLLGLPADGHPRAGVVMSELLDPG